jgi:UDP-glucose 4-epimerase
MPERILVTGGAGFIGSRIAHRLLKTGYDVDIIDDLSTGLEANLPTGAKFIQQDLTQPDALGDMENRAYYAVFHLAGQASGQKSFEDPQQDLLVNAHTTSRLLQQCHHLKVKHFLYASSMGVYGNPTNLPVEETCPPVPTSFYGANKLESENYCRVFQGLGLSTTCFRMFNVYGPGQNLANMKQGMVSIYLAYLLKKERITIKGSLERFRDFVYIDDVVDVWMTAFLNPAASGGVFNVASGVKTTVRDLVGSLFLAFKGRELTAEDYEEVKGTPGDQFGLYANIDHIQSTLNWSPSVSLEEGLARLVAWAKTR